MIRLERPVLISACLLGKPCRYDGSHRGRADFEKTLEGTRWISVCPETLAGLPIPRPPAEIIGTDGEAVLDGQGRIMDREGHDRTINFLEGARKMLEIAQTNHVAGAILKAKSPSCGKGLIYNGSFNGETHPGNGVAAALLLRHGIPVWTEDEWVERMKERV